MCFVERRCLITLDLDFANPIHYKPSDYAGICVLRLPKKCTQSQLLMAVKTLIKYLETEDVTGRLWIVEIGRVREHEVPLEHDPWFNGPEWTVVPT